MTAIDSSLYSLGERIYHNPFAKEKDVGDFIMEGQAAIIFPQGRMRMENVLDPKLGQQANFVFWCPVDFPDSIAATWEFWPVREPGLCMTFFSAAGAQGEDLFDAGLAPRTGVYPEYHHGDMNAYHVSYFRRKEADERSFHTCNLRKSFGLHLVAQGGDPIPSVGDAAGPYRIKLLKWQDEIVFMINEMTVFQWKDDGVTYGKRLEGGKIGFRQLAPMIGEYANLNVYALERG
ncbi:YesU family protein [Paenibacillus doosanensis]|uniref:YesU family protein n=1 Tax=Paenibacillus doosanensis TaxID=1229154 RepID=UPI00217F4687|nr:YesU family protein [Paenibacillus doosanensis]MCS7462600.1 YesU family protein [Paenibacillus doosanensis]